MRAAGLLPVFGLIAALQGCADLQEQWFYRYGPNPYPEPTAIAVTVEREFQVVDALVRGVGYGRIEGAPSYPTSAEEWYGVILMGFNTVDDACTAYINNLWKMDRQRGRITNVLTTTGAAVAAIIGAGADPTPATLTILAQAFGLASALTNSIADSYLYTQSPATILKLVKKTTDAYRNDFADNFYKRSHPISHPAIVYQQVRSYLALCLPPTIQAQIDDYLASAKAGPESVVKREADKPEAAKGGGAMTTNIQLY